MLKIVFLEFSSFVIGQNRSGSRNSRLLLAESSVTRMFWKDNHILEFTDWQNNALELEFSSSFFYHIKLLKYSLISSYYSHNTAGFRL